MDEVELRSDDIVHSLLEQIVALSRQLAVSKATSASLARRVRELEEPKMTQKEAVPQ